MKTFRVIAVASLLGLMLPLQSVSADSAFDWGRWDSNTQSAEAMLATSDGVQTSLNQGAVCMQGNCTYDRNHGTYTSPSSTVESDPVQVACRDVNAKADCQLGPEVSQK